MDKETRIAFSADEIEEYRNIIGENPRYSLTVNPEGKYRMSDEEKQVVALYIEFKDLSKVAFSLNLPLNQVRSMFYSYAVQQEIRRINMALYHRQFAGRLASVDEIGGYLTSMLTGECLSPSDMPKTIDEKLKVVDRILSVHKLKNESKQNPDIIMDKDINIDFRDVTVDTIRKLIDTTENPPEEQEPVPLKLAELPTEKIIEMIEAEASEPEEKPKDKTKRSKKKK